MSQKIIIIKVLDTQESITRRFGESFDGGGARRYYPVTSDTDKGIAEDFYDEVGDDDIFVVSIVFKRDEKERDKIISLYVGSGYMAYEPPDEAPNWKIYYEIKKKVDSDLIIRDFESNLALNLWDDFGKHSYINIEETPGLTEQIRNILHVPYETTPCEQIYDEIGYEEKLHPYSQRNRHCLRPLGYRQPQEGRGEFQRDCERIIHAKAYRRLVDKAQIFTASRGDHYRTRMTHTIEVAQVARAIAVGININTHLTEAIAQVHDLGHTPFGHQGERTLDAILEGCWNILPTVGKNFYGGFKHNFQTLRLANCLEEKYVEFPGLDLSYQVLEGALKHTKAVVKRCDDCPNGDACTKKCYDLQEFLPNGDVEQLYLEQSFPTTLEGQIVSIADEIAQRSHDLDDAFSAHLISADSLIKDLSIRKMAPLKERLLEIDRSVKAALEQNRQFVDAAALAHSRIVATIINFFIDDVIRESLARIARFEEDEMYREKHRFSRELIAFSQKGQALCDYLENIISKKVINSLEVVQFDSRAEQVVRELFRTYYNNPRLLHKGTLRRIFIETLETCEFAICFQNSDHTVVRDEIEKILHPPTDRNDDYWKKQKILVRAIADFISGMTDSYALNEYHKIVRY